MIIRIVHFCSRVITVYYTKIILRGFSGTALLRGGMAGVLAYLKNLCLKGKFSSGTEFEIIF